MAETGGMCEDDAWEGGGDVGARRGGEAIERGRGAGEDGC
jgi:hypothetical protein